MESCRVKCTVTQRWDFVRRRRTNNKCFLSRERKKKRETLTAVFIKLVGNRSVGPGRVSSPTTPWARVFHSEWSSYSMMNRVISQNRPKILNERKEREEESQLCTILVVTSSFYFTVWGPHESHVVLGQTPIKTTQPPFPSTHEAFQIKTNN